MKKYDKEILGKRISSFFVNSNTSNEEVLQKIYEDFSKKINFMVSLYPFTKGLMMYDYIFKIFGLKIELYKWDRLSTERFTDTFEESNKALEDGVFTVTRDLFGSGEWPIILFDRTSEEGKDKDYITYTISR